MIKKSAVPITIREEEYEIVVNVGSMLDVEEATGQGFMEVLAETGGTKLSPAINLLAHCLRVPGADIGVGVYFIKQLESWEFEELTLKMVEAIRLSMPELTGEERKN